MATPAYYATISVRSTGDVRRPFATVEAAGGRMSTSVERDARRASLALGTFSQQAQTAMRQASAAIGAFPGFARLAGQFGAASNLFETTTARFATAVAAAASAAQALSSVSTLQAYQERLRATTDSVEEFNAAQSSTLRIARASRSDLGETIRAYARLAETTERLGLNSKQLETVLITVQRGIQLSGATTQEAAAAMQQFSQALGAGRLNGDEFRSLGENARVVLRGIADEIKRLNLIEGFDGTIEQLRDLGAEGKVTSDIVAKAVLAMSGTIDERFNRMNVTIGQAATAIRTSLQQLVLSFESATGLFGGAAAAIYGLANNMEMLVTVGAAVTAVVGVRMAGALLTTANATTGLSRAQVAQVAVMRTLIGSTALYSANLLRLGAAQGAAAVSTRALAAAMTVAQVAGYGLLAVGRGLLALFGGPLGVAIAGVTALWAYNATKMSDVQRAADILGISEDELRKRYGLTTEAINSQNFALAENARLKLSSSLSDTRRRYSSSRNEAVVATAFGIDRSQFSNKADRNAAIKLQEDYNKRLITTSDLVKGLSAIAARNPGFQPYYEQIVGKTEDIIANAAALTELGKQKAKLENKGGSTPVTGFDFGNPAGVAPRKRTKGELEAEAKALAAGTDLVARATADYAKAKAELDGLLKDGKITETEYVRRLADARQALNAAKEAEKARAAGLRESKQATDAAERATAKFLDTMNDFIREAERLQETKNSWIDDLTRKYAPLEAAAAQYREELEKIATLQGEGLITAGQASTFRVGAQRSYSEAWTDEFLKDAPQELKDAIEESGKNFRKEVAIAARAFSDVLGDLFGRKAGGLAAVLGVDSENTSLGKAFKSGFESFNKDYLRKFSDVFGDSSQFGEAMGQLGGAWAIGSKSGALADGIMDELGIKSSKLGAQIGGTLGSFAGPIGTIAGSIAGGLIGGLFKKAKTGVANVSYDGSNFVTGITGNSKAYKQQAEGLGSSVEGGLERIAEAFNGALTGVAKVSIGIRDGKYRVDPTGRGKTKKKNGAVDFGSDAEAAVQFAILDAINDGIIVGLRKGTERLLKAGGDFERAIEKATRFEDVFRRLRQFTDPVGLAIDDLNREFEQLKKIFAEAGASAEEYSQLEQLYNLERAEAVKQASESMNKALQALLEDLTISDSSGLSLRDRQAAALAKFNPLAQEIRTTGKVSDQEAFGEAVRQLLEIEREIFGSGKGYFDRLSEVTDLTRQALGTTVDPASIASQIGSPFTASNAAAANTIANSVETQTELLLAQGAITNDLLAQLLTANRLGALGGANALRFGGLSPVYGF